MADDAQRSLRAELRTWLGQTCPPALRVPGNEGRVAWGGRNRSGQSDDALRWMQAMAARGFIAPRWPLELGGACMSEAEAAVLSEELQRIGAPPPILSFGLWMLAPILFEYGSDEQRRRFLPPIARGEIRWCQGYSEPGAGSDLAALKTRCEDDGDHWVVNGQKLWTSDAHVADWMFCLVRTDPAVKQAGISFILIDMDSPGVDRRPIRLISGASPFCETFFTDVRVPKDQMVGRLNGGWEIAKRLLQYERRTISDAGTAGTEALHAAVARRGATLDPVLRDRVARIEMREHALALTLLRANQEGGVSHLASALKVAGSLLRQDRAEVIVDALGLASLVEQPVPHAAMGVGETTDVGAWLRTRSATIEGGTTEINLNVIAKRILQLPDAL